MSTSNYVGLLFIGDPHVSSKTIGRRKDDYTQSVLDKLAFCAELCRQRNLIPIITGDLFHKNSDNNIVFLNKLFKVFKLFPRPPIVLEGNHDKGKFSLSDEDSMQLLELGGVIRVSSVARLFETVNVSGFLVNIFTCPYGAAIPVELPVKEGTSILLTHHDLAFGSSYPGSLPLTPIKNCAMVVNGHMHDTKKSVLVEDTWWHNPGNIEPLSIDHIDHVPCAWEWLAGSSVSSLTPIELPHGRDIFELTGLHVAAADAGESVSHLATKASQFADLLAAQSAAGAPRTDSAAILMEDVSAVLEESNVSDAAKSLLRALAADLSMESVATLDTGSADLTVSTT